MKVQYLVYQRVGHGTDRYVLVRQTGSLVLALLTVFALLRQGYTTEIVPITEFVPGEWGESSEPKFC